MEKWSLSGRALVIFHNARGAALFVLDRPPAQSGARRGVGNGPPGRKREGGELPTRGASGSVINREVG